MASVVVVVVVVVMVVVSVVMVVVVVVFKASHRLTVSSPWSAYCSSQVEAVLSLKPYGGIAPCTDRHHAGPSWVGGIP